MTLTTVSQKLYLSVHLLPFRLNPNLNDLQLGDVSPPSPFRQFPPFEHLCEGAYRFITLPSVIVIPLQQAGAVVRENVKPVSSGLPSPPFPFFSSSNIEAGESSQLLSDSATNHTPVVESV